MILEALVVLFLFITIVIALAALWRTSSSYGFILTAVVAAAAMGAVATWVLDRLGML